MRISFPIRRIGAAILVALAAWLAVSVLLTSSGQARPRAIAVKPTIVLVHGAWADSSSWDGEISRLQADGYPVVAPANPLRSLSGDAAFVEKLTGDDLEELLAE